MGGNYRNIDANIYYWSVTDRKWTGVDNDRIFYLTLFLLKNRTT